MLQLTTEEIAMARKVHNHRTLCKVVKMVMKRNDCGLRDAYDAVFPYRSQYRPR